MTKDEALKLALNVLINRVDADHEAITAVREVLAQPEQEPLATMWQHNETGRTRITTPDSITDCDAAWFKVSDLYTAPPPRKPLTDEDLRKLMDKHLFYQPEGYEVSGVFALARAIEAAHNIKE